MADEPRPYVPAEENLAELTLKAVVLGVVVAALLGAANAYLGFKAGQTASATFPAAVLVIAAFRLPFFRGPCSSRTPCAPRRRWGRRSWRARSSRSRIQVFKDAAGIRLFRETVGVVKEFPTSVIHHFNTGRAALGDVTHRGALVWSTSSISPALLGVGYIIGFELAAMRLS